LRRNRELELSSRWAHRKSRASAQRLGRPRPMREHDRLDPSYRLRANVLRVVPEDRGQREAQGGSSICLLN
jgi:hypothetical protein